MSWDHLREKTGNGVWLGVAGNIVFAGMGALCLVNVAPGTYLRAGMEFLGIAFYAVLFALVALPVSVSDLLRRRYWGLMGFVFALTPLPLSYAVYSWLFVLKGLHVEG